jgi:hypothetical protein
MFIGFFVQRKIVFFPGKEAFPFIGKIIFLILPADADNRVCI